MALATLTVSGRSISVRDPNRIPIIMEALRKEWEYSPDQRLCQLISNITRGNLPAGSTYGDLFNLEDDRFMKDLIEYSTNFGSNRSIKND